MANTLEAVSSYLEGTREEIDISNGYPFSCSSIALDIAKIIQNIGNNPRIIDFRGQIIDTTGNRQSLTPRRWNGRLSWGAHLVCEEGGVVYDPVLPKPISLEDYPGIAFEDTVDVFRVIEGEELDDLLSRKN